MASSEPSWTRVHRAVRALPDGEGPFRGTLVADRGENVVAVPLVDLEGWEGWAHAGAVHVAAPGDVALLDSGFHALLPWCTLEVEALLARRRASEDALSSGEVCTLVISVLRGLAELGEALGQIRGTWWLTHDARPVFVPGEGREAGESARMLFADLAGAVPDRRLARLLAQVTDAAERPRALVREAERWEGEFLESAAPQPLRVDVLAPALVRSIPRLRDPRGEGRGEALGRDDRREPFRGDSRDDGRDDWRGSLRGDGREPRRERARSVTRQGRNEDRWEERAGRRRSESEGMALPERLRDRLDRMRLLLPRRHSRGREHDGMPARRPRRLLVAAGAAGVVLLGGILWPANAGDSAPGSALTSSSTGSDPVPFTPVPAPPEGVPDQIAEPEEPEVAFTNLVALARGCLIAGDAGCAAVFLASADIDAAVLTGLVEASSEVSLVDDFGDIAVLRVAREQGGEQMIVLVRHDERWLIRDVYDLGRS